MATDSERLEALADALNRMIVYEVNGRGEHFKIDFQSRHERVKGKRYGASADFLRKIADGIIEARGPRGHQVTNS
jgi:hypothetical protein